jgi:four helix bundle protein
MNNIAEGYERKSNKELSQFFYVAKGSAGEVRSMNYLGFDLKYISEEDFKNIHQRTLEIARILSGLIRSLK